MKTGNIVLPLFDNDGASIAEAHCALQALLCDWFGGFTQIASEGAWKRSDGTIQKEPGTFYVFSGEFTATHPLEFFCEELFGIGCYARQEALYWAWDGVAHVVTLPTREQVKAEAQHEHAQ